MDYQTFLDSKAQLANNHGFTPHVMPTFLFDFQAHLVDWAVRKGRAAIFGDCGLGKTPMQLAWAENVVSPFRRWDIETEYHHHQLRAVTSLQRRRFLWGGMR